MIYCLQSHAEFIAQTNPIEARPEELATLLQAIVSPLLLITDELTDRMNEGYTANDAVRDYLTSDEYTAKIEKRSGGES